MNWHQYPLLRLLIPYLLGVVIAANVLLPGNTGYFCVFVFSILLLALIATPYLPRSYHLLAGVAVSLLFVLIGVLRIFQHSEQYNPHHFQQYLDSTNSIIAVLNEPATEKPNSIKSTATIRSVFHDHKWVNCSGNVMLYFKKDSLAAQLQRGDQLVLNSKIARVLPPANPGEFDYRKYLFNQNIYHQGYVNKSHWKMLSSGGKGILAFADKARDKLLNIFKENNLQGDEYAVISALLLGYQDKIDPETLRNFSGAGIVHILSVSGLHVGIIFMVLSYLLSFLNKTSKGTKIRIIIVLVCIWFYALITGLAPPILRSALMFSVILIAELLMRKSNINQSILLSLFVLLLINPYYLFDTGFQLSYLAVIGIVQFQKAIVVLFSPKYRLIKMGWELTAVSIAAQLTTLPLTLYYFHQFPSYFILANLIAIPYTNVLMFVGIAVILFSPLSLISSFVGIVLARCLFWFNEIIRIINQMPYASIQNLHFDAWDAILVGLIVFLLAIWVQTKNHRMIFIMLLFVFIFSSKQIGEKVQVLHHRNITVYSIQHHTVVGFIDGNQCRFITDSSMHQQSSTWKSSISNNLTNNRISEVNFISGNEYADDNFFRMNNFVQFYDRRIAIIDSTISKQKHAAVLAVDILIVTQKSKKNVERILKEYSPKQVVADASISPYYSKRWLDACKKANIGFFDVKTEGAFQLDIQ